jgi:hypothetical protein
MTKSQSKMTRAWEMDSVMGLVFAREDAEGLIREITLLEGELAGRVRTKKRPR